MKNGRIQLHCAFLAQRWGAGAGARAEEKLPSHGPCLWLGPTRPLPPLCYSWSRCTSEFADPRGPGPSQGIPSCETFLLSKVKAKCAGISERSWVGWAALPCPSSPRESSASLPTLSVFSDPGGSWTCPGVLSGPGSLRTQTWGQPRKLRQHRATHTSIAWTLCVPVSLDRRTHSVCTQHRSSHCGCRGDSRVGPVRRPRPRQERGQIVFCEDSGTVHSIMLPMPGPGTLHVVIRKSV